MRVDLKDDPKLYYNYKVTDVESPAAQKNSFSKTISLEGTDNNNAIFGDIFDLSRLQQYGGVYAGTDFNPLRKADFELYIDSELYETGYFKLTEINVTGHKITYSIQLFGGLGEFIQGLSENANGGKLEFKDLKIINDLNDPIEIDPSFTISKETIDEAWNSIDDYSSKYSTINFAPCYNGTPDSFDASHCLVNLSGKTSMGNLTGISSYHQWAKGEASRNLTEWETRDLRSHQQRPVVRVKSLLQSICLPENNGGYQVELDTHFFHMDNPYYADSWMSLKPIKDMQGEDEGTSETVTGATLTEKESAGETLFYVNTDADFSEYNNLQMETQVVLRNEFDSFDITTTADTLYTSTYYKVTNSSSPFNSSYVRKSYQRESVVLLQLIAFDEIGKVVATSAAYQLSSLEDVDYTRYLNTATQEYEIPEWKMLTGKFIKSGNRFIWADMDGNPQTIKFNFPSNTAFRTLAFRIKAPYWEKWYTTGLFGGSTSRSSSNGNRYYFPELSTTANGSHTPDWYRNKGVYCTPILTIGDFSVNATRYGGFLSGKHISKDRILTLGITPAEWLLSYTKLFDLRIWKDPIDKKIYIQDRNTFYDRDTIVDLQEYIDHSKAIKITPQVAKARWYDFSTEQNTSEANTQYTDTYGMEFGLQRVNTSYDFDTSNEQVYNGKFKGGVQVLEASPYYYNDYQGWPVYVYNGFTLTTYSLSGTTLVGTDNRVNTQSDAKQYPYNSTYQGFDLFDKPQFHSEDNSAEDGAFTMLFYRGEKMAASDTAGDIAYFITDDLEQMISLNDKQPCWIMTDKERGYNNEKIAIQRHYLPHFSRYMSYPETGFITHSWDFGKTLETYIPGTFMTEGCSIYDKFWKNYISDMYDVNSRILSCYVLIRGQVNPEWLRRFYFFDNSWWRLNQVKEWNPGNYVTTSCEFLKVNDIENYSLERVTTDPIFDFYLPDYIGTRIDTSDYSSHRYYTIGASVSSVTAYIEVQDGGPWSFGDGPGSYYSVDYGDGSTRILPYSGLTESGDDGGNGNTAETLLVGVNDSGSARTFQLDVCIYGASGDYWRYVHITQEATDVGSISVRRFAGSGTINPNGMTVLLEVISDSPWTATTDDSYVDIRQENGPSGLTNIEVYVNANTGSTQRTAHVHFENVNGGETDFSEVQAAPGEIYAFEFGADSYTFNATGGTINGYVKCPTNMSPWSITQIPEWITATPTSGIYGETQVVLTASANNTGSDRFGDVRASSAVDAWTIHFGQRS